MATAFPLNVRLGRDAERWLDATFRRPALFLDRDGVLNVDRDYLRSAGDVALLPGAGGAVARANRAGVPVVVVSNQSGVGRGYFGWDAVAAVDERLAALLAAEGGALDLVLSAAAGPSAPEGGRFRKPNPGMFHLAARLLPLDLASSWMVGDKAGDLEAAASAGLAGGVLVSGKPGQSLDGARVGGGRFAAHEASSAGGAIDALLPRLVEAACHEPTRGAGERNRP